MKAPKIQYYNNVLNLWKQNMSRSLKHEKSLKKGVDIYQRLKYNLGVILLQEVKNMNKGELIAKIAEESKLTKKAAEAALDAFVSAVEGALKAGDKVQLVGFGTFQVKERAARKGRNPQTKAEIKIPASKAPVSKAGKALKETVNK